MTRVKTDAQFNQALLRLALVSELAWILLAALVLLLTTGCQTNEKQSRKMLLPPMPGAANQNAGGSTTEAQAVAPYSPPKLTGYWNKGDTNADTVTEFWATEDFTNWFFYAESKEPVLEIIADQPHLFFKYRNRLYNQYSDWARK